ncbi:putative methyltransferase DDB_G0268948 isoform X2 [Lissotriton helveticus]
MTYFQTKKHASLYQKYMIREPKEVISLILSYLEKKKGKPFELAVDVGCGTGQSTRILASHFKKVVGMDISEAQIKEAENVETSPNVSYVVAAAEKIPLKDGSVDLTTSSVAAHWFEVDGFLREVDRVLKPNGCLALYCLIPHFDLHYKDCSKCLTDTFMEAHNFLLREHGDKRIDLMSSEYKEIFDAVPFADKTRVTNILLKCSMSITALLGLLESLCMFQNFSKMDPETAKAFLGKLQERLLQIMGVSSLDTEVEVHSNYFCVLACKSK